MDTATTRDSSMATTMAAHRPFAPRTNQPDNLTTTTTASAPLSETPTAAQTPGQPQSNNTDSVTEVPAKKAPKIKAQPKQALIILKDKDFMLTDAILNKIKVFYSDPSHRSSC